MTKERKLASVQKILALNPIPGADRIEVATVLGWQVVVQKGLYKVGDLVVYFEIDSMLPDRSPYAEVFKAIPGSKPEGYRLRTVRLRGQVSQGLCMPLTVVQGPEPEASEGDDLTPLIGVKKYDPPIPNELAGKAKGLFPSFIPKTDEIRIQSEPWLLEKYRDEPFVICEKLDGTSVTFYHKFDASLEPEFGVCTRNYDLLETEGNTQWTYARKMKLPDLMRELGRSYAFQGEMMGPGIQGNKYKLTGHTVFFFSAYDITKQEFLPHNDASQLIKTLGLLWVPVVEHCLLAAYDSVEACLKLADRHSAISPVVAEGVVFRPHREIRDPAFGRVSFKAINNNFLLKNEE